MKQIDENANGATIEAERNEILQIRLSENRTAGYKWTIRSDGSPVCKPLDEHFLPPSVGLGAKGIHHCTERVSSIMARVRRSLSFNVERSDDAGCADGGNSTSCNARTA